MIEAIYTGPERVECRGAEHTGPNAEGDLARALIGAGVDPAAPMASVASSTAGDQPGVSRRAG